MAADHTVERTRYARRSPWAFGAQPKGPACRGQRTPASLLLRTEEVID